MYYARSSASVTWRFTLLRRRPWRRFVATTQASSDSDSSISRTLSATEPPSPSSILGKLPSLDTLRYPTPFINDEQFTSFLEPLWSHWWRITVDKSFPGREAIFLHRQYKFFGWKGAMAFVNEVDMLARQEKVRDSYPL
ncbi:hypothetical protein PUNSTDRAFT_56133, partial [Punctularia strigosozonata HHB-11173 SS5]